MGGYCNCFEIQADILPRLERGLREVGFTEPPQLVMEQQVFGLSKELDDVWQLHIRGYENGRLQAEVEVKWIYIEHAKEPSRSGHPWLRNCLLKLGIPFRETAPPKDCLNPSLELPQSLTKWEDLSVESLVRSMVKGDLPAKHSINDLGSFFGKQWPLALSKSTLERFLEFEGADDCLRVKVNCPVYSVHADWCEGRCLSLVHYLLGFLGQDIVFRRLAKRPEGEACLFEFCSRAASGRGPLL